MIETILMSWAEQAQEEIKSLLEKAGRSNDPLEKAYYEAKIQERRERKTALHILRKGIR